MGLGISSSLAWDMPKKTEGFFFVGTGNWMENWWVVWGIGFLIKISFGVGLEFWVPGREHCSKVAAEQHTHCPTRWSCLRLSYNYIGFISITHLTLPDGYFNILLTYLKTFSLLWDSKCLFKWTARINDFWQPSWGHTQGLYKINSIITSLTIYRENLSYFPEIYLHSWYGFTSLRRQLSIECSKKNML